MKSTLVTSYVNPDLDGIASAIAYGEFLQKRGKNAVVGVIGEPQDEAKYIFTRFGFAYPNMISNTDAFDEVILVDASDLNGLKGKIDHKKVIEIIDHRKTNEAHKFSRANAQIELVGAAATLIAEKFMLNNIDISKKSATLVHGAIISNTLNYKGSVTTDRDKKAASWLNRVTKLPHNFWKELFIAKSDVAGKKLAKRIGDDFAWFILGEKKVGIAQIEMMGAKNLIEERGAEIVYTLEKIKKEMHLDIVFQNTIDLEGGKNFFIANDHQTKQLLEKVLKVRFAGIVAEKPGLMMRKQIIPLIKDELEKK